MEKKRGKGAEIWGLLSAGMSAGSLREENLLMEAEERKKKDLKDLFYFFSPCEQLCSFLFLPVRRKGWELLFNPAVQLVPRSQGSQKSFKASW